MASFVKFELDDGTFVYIEATDVPRGSSGFPLAGRGDHPTELEAVPFEDAILPVRRMAAMLVKEMHDGFAQPPDEMQVNFGLKASAEVGNLIVSRGGMEANFNVMLRWRQKDEAEAAPADGPSADAKAAESKPEDEKPKEKSARGAKSAPETQPSVEETGA
jgi:hypothetical protein